LKTPKTLFCSPEFPCARERISSKFVDSLGTPPQKVRQPWPRVRVTYQNTWLGVCLLNAGEDMLKVIIKV